MLRTWVCRVIPPDDVDCGSMPIGWQAGGPAVANALGRTARTLSIGRAPRITLLDPRSEGKEASLTFVSSDPDTLPHHRGPRATSRQFPTICRILSVIRSAKFMS